MSSRYKASYHLSFPTAYLSSDLHRAPSLPEPTVLLLLPNAYISVTHLHNLLPEPTIYSGLALRQHLYATPTYSALPHFLASRTHSATYFLSMPRTLYQSLLLSFIPFPYCMFFPPAHAACITRLYYETRMPPSFFSNASKIALFRSGWVDFTL